MTQTIDNRSGIHLTGEDTGWPVGEDFFPDESVGTGLARYKDGSVGPNGFAQEYYAKADAIDNGLVYVNEQVEILVHGDGGSFTLEHDGEVTDPIDASVVPDYEALAAAIQEALEALSNIGAGNVVARVGYLADFSPEPTIPQIQVQFVGDLAHTDVSAGEDLPSALIADYTLLTSATHSGGPYVSVGWEDGSPYALEAP